MKHFTETAPAVVEDALFSDPLSDRIRRAFAEAPPDACEARVLGTLLRHPGSTGPELSARCGWQAGAWFTHLTVLSWRRRAALSPGAAVAQPYTLLTQYDAATSRFTLKPEAADVLRDLGLESAR